MQRFFYLTCLSLANCLISKLQLPLTGVISAIVQWEKIIYTYFWPKYCDASGADDWKTSNKSPTYIGHIGKNFKHKLVLKPPVAFRRIPGKVGVYPLDFVKSLNNDGRYLYFISHAIQDGVVPQYLAKKIIGHTNKARYFHCKVLWSRAYCKEGCNWGHGLSAAIKLGTPEPKLLQYGCKLNCSQ